jgi:uroporphyrin-III C-methyltransferase / precorrin-2 dehydrogenase / sirohydrochlorin ferrochelatase
MRGLVSLVGAGPGDPELLTLRAARRLEQAEVVLHDALVAREVLALARNARLVDVGKRAGRASPMQESISRQLVDYARGGARVVRLKGGDPFVLGRGGEELLALSSAGIPWEVVPGISSATGLPALSGIPLTYRGMSSAFLVVSGHSKRTYGPVLGGLPPRSATVVILMGLARREEIAAYLIERGWSPRTPCALLLRGSTPAGSKETATLADWTEASIAPPGPGTLIIGDVVALTRFFVQNELIPTAEEKGVAS